MSCDNYSTIDHTPEQEILHQAHSYSLAIRGFILASVFVYILGIGSFLAGKVPEGRITTASESISKILFVLVKLDKQNNDRLERLAKEFKEDD